jgi:hypothetical protein
MAWMLKPFGQIIQPTQLTQSSTGEKGAGKLSITGRLHQTSKLFAF